MLLQLQLQLLAAVLAAGLARALPVFESRCLQHEVSPGHFTVLCDFAQPEHSVLEREDVLWLKANGGDDQTIDVALPTYFIKQAVTAAFKAGPPNTGNKINIRLPAPQVQVDAGQQGGDISVNSRPTVHLEYEPAPPHTLVHYAKDKPFREPQQQHFNSPEDPFQGSVQNRPDPFQGQQIVNNSSNNVQNSQSQSQNNVQQLISSNLDKFLEEVQKLGGDDVEIKFVSAEQDRLDQPQRQQTVQPILH